MQRERALNQLTQLGCFAADIDALKLSRFVTDAERTRVDVAAALDALESNGLIAFTVGGAPRGYAPALRGGKP